MKKVRKAMVLAAGLGTRLLPITAKIPKPLVPVANVPNVVHTLDLLRRAGVEAAILNLHHLGPQLESFLGDGRRFGIQLHYSKEPGLLGTGGGVKKAEAFFDGEPFVLANCDFVTNAELKPFLDRHLERGALATMVLVQDEAIQKHYSKVGADASSHLCSLPKLHLKDPAKTGIFTGIHFLDASVLRHLQPVASGINEILYPALMRENPDRVFVDFFKKEYWLDTGEVDTLWKAHRRLFDLWGDRLGELLSRFGSYRALQPGVWAEEPLPKGLTARGPVIIGKGCRFGAGCELGPYAVLGDGCHLEERAMLRNAVAIQATIPAGQVYEKGIVFDRLILPAEESA